MLKIALTWSWWIPIYWYIKSTNNGRHILHAWMDKDYRSPVYEYWWSWWCQICVQYNQSNVAYRVISHTTGSTVWTVKRCLSYKCVSRNILFQCTFIHDIDFHAQVSTSAYSTHMHICHQIKLQIKEAKIRWVFFMEMWYLSLCRLAYGTCRWSSPITYISYIWLVSI